MDMAETSKSQLEADPDEEKKKEEAPPTTSGRLPSPYTEMRQKADASTRTEQRNSDIEFTRRDFHALVNRAINSPAIRFVPAKRQTAAR